MYLPSYHQQTDLDALFGLIESCPLGLLVTPEVGGALGPGSADHLPFVLDRSRGPFGTLRAHVARANPVWKRWVGGDQPCLVVFQAADQYISPSWYPGKAEHGKVVPTWNYRAVHGSGRPQLIEQPVELLALLEQLTDRQESGEKPWRVADAPADFIERLMRAVVGFEIPLQSLVGRWKLSQDEALPDRLGTVAGLRERDTAAARELAEQIEQTISFSS